jgi:hypothetical protein
LQAQRDTWFKRPVTYLAPLYERNKYVGRVPGCLGKTFAMQVTVSAGFAAMLIFDTRLP